MPSRAWCGLIVTLLIGCGGRHTVAPVSGVVTLDDRPLVGAHVAFQPIRSGDNRNPGPGSVGKTDKNGRFTLRLAADGDHSPGAIVGKHRVLISGLDNEQIEISDAGANIPIDPVPKHYNVETKLTFDVSSDGTDKADFKLSSKQIEP